MTSTGDRVEKTGSAIRWLLFIMIIMLLIGCGESSGGGVDGGISDSCDTEIMEAQTDLIIEISITPEEVIEVTADSAGDMLDVNTSETTVGLTCLIDADCPSGVCIMIYQGDAYALVCTGACINGGCPQGFSCVQDICLPHFYGLCRPCTEDFQSGTSFPSSLS